MSFVCGLSHAVDGAHLQIPPSRAHVSCAHSAMVPPRCIQGPPFGSQVHVPASQLKRGISCRAQPDDSPPSSTKDAQDKPPPPSEQDTPPKMRNRTAMETPDMISSQLTRRFGIVGGLAWFGFLAVGSLGEQVKTRLEVAREEANAQDVTGELTTLTSGVSFQDLRIGGGREPQRRDLVVLDFRLSVDGKVVEDTYSRNKPIVFPFRSRPFTGGVCAGVEEALSTMKAGGKRLVTVPPEAGFGSEAYALRGTRHAGEKEGIVPPNSTLEYELNLVRVSVPPS